MFRKVTHCAGRGSANTRPHQLRWGDQEMGTAISCTKCSQVAGLIQKLVETPRNSKAPSLCPAVLRVAVFHLKILCSDRNHCMYVFRFPTVITLARPSPAFRGFQYEKVGIAWYLTHMSMT